MENKLEKESSIDTIATESTVEEEYKVDTNIEHFLIDRLKQIEDEATVNRLREQYQSSKQTNTEPKKRYFAFRPFLEFFKALGVIY